MTALSTGSHESMLAKVVAKTHGTKVHDLSHVRAYVVNDETLDVESAVPSSGTESSIVDCSRRQQRYIPEGTRIICHTQWGNRWTNGLLPQSCA
jgi:hypothetical protein